MVAGRRAALLLSQTEGTEGSVDAFLEPRSHITGPEGLLPPPWVSLATLGWCLQKCSWFFSVSIFYLDRKIVIFLHCHETNRSLTSVFVICVADFLYF